MPDAQNHRLPFLSDFEKVRKNIYFILLEPESYGNIGASARALKTCGFNNLVLVNPRVDINHPETSWMAHQSVDILKGAHIVATLREAIADKKLVVGTTQRKRQFKFPLYTPEEITDKIEEIGLDDTVAIVFGRERTGLTNRELLQCHIHSTILTATYRPALNLAQSVMIYAHTFFKSLNIKNARYTYDLATQGELESFYDHLQGSLNQVGFVPRDSMDDFISRFKRLIGRSLAEKRDIRLLHKLLQIYEKKIRLLEKQSGSRNSNLRIH
jgi:tRNA (cytidine32/uridine32-2'-O)-methyltransferase